MPVFFLFLFVTMLAVVLFASMMPRSNSWQLYPLFRRLTNGRKLETKTTGKIASRRRRKKIQVVVDIDDTVKSSGNARIADIPLGGIDGQYDRGSFYPGVFEFVAEMANCAQNFEPEPVAVLTARARELKFALELSDEDSVCRGFKMSSLGKEWGIDAARVMYGSLHEWLFQDFKAWRKFTNFELLAKQLGDLPAVDTPKNPTTVSPGREYVFVGDTGEMDRQAGELILSRHPRLAKAVFLHCVGPALDGSDVFVPVDYAIGGGRVYHFRTYVGAAAKAVKAGYLDSHAFERVVQATLDDIRKHNFDEDGLDTRNRKRDVDHDVKQGRALLASIQNAPQQCLEEEEFDLSSDDEELDVRVVPITKLVPTTAPPPSSFWRKKTPSAW